MFTAQTKYIGFIIGALFVLTVPLFAWAQHNGIEQAKKHYNEGDYTESLKIALNVYRSGTQTKQPQTIADAGNLIGLIRLAQAQPAEALQYFRQASLINLKLRNFKRLAANQINIGLCFADLNQPDSSIVYLDSALTKSRLFKANNLIAMSLNHLGDAWAKKNDLNTAERYYSSVLHNKTFQSDWENSFASAGMARLRNQQAKYREAGDYADRAFNYALKADAKWDAAQALAIAHKAYWSMGDTKKAYARLLAYKLYSDSVLSHDKERALNNLLLKEKSYENDRLQKQVSIVSQKRKIDQLIILLAAVITLFMTLLAVQLLKNYNRTKLVNKKLSDMNDAAILENTDLNKANHYKDRMFAIIGHDLRSPLAGLYNSLQLFKDGDISSEELYLIVNQMSEQLEGTSGMLDSLLVWAGNQLGGITTKPVEIDLTKKIDKVISGLSVIAERKKITIIHGRRQLPPVKGDADQIRIILQNLIGNAIKYTKAAGTIQIFYALGETIHLFIKDDGIGMSESDLQNIVYSKGLHTSTYGTANEKGIGLGLQLVKEFAAQNQILIHVDSTLGKGTTFQLTFNKVV